MKAKFSEPNYAEHKTDKSKLYICEVNNVKAFIFFRGRGSFSSFFLPIVQRVIVSTHLALVLVILLSLRPCTRKLKDNTR